MEVAPDQQASFDRSSEPAQKSTPPTRKPETSKPPAMIRDYWPRYKKRAIAASIAMQCIVTLAIGGALVAGDVIAPGVVLAVILLAIFAATTGLNVILILLLLSPLQNLANALTHVAGEPTTTTPPNPNATRFENDGFKPLLQLIYEIGAREKLEPGADASSTTVTRATASTLERGLNETNAGIVILGHDRRVIYANRAAPVRTNMQGEPELELVFDDASDTLKGWLDAREESDVRATKRWRRIPNKLVGDEDRRIFDIAANYEKGSEAETVLVFYDYTSDYQPEDDDLDFIAFAAHELRGPITVIRGYLDVFGDELDGQLNPEQRELLQRLVVSANRLSSYINNILNASRYDRRHLQVHLSEETLANVYSSIADDMSERAHAQNRLLSVEFPADLPTIAADRASLSEVIGNLIDNAIKYSNEGGTVAVSAHVDGDYVIVKIEDHGIGMPGSVVSNLFHKFYRSHRSRETVAGTGIGLYISKAIVESHGGQISVRSQEGEGSTFEFSVPIYSKVADKLAGVHSDNSKLISSGGGWIKNHSMYRG